MTIQFAVYLQTTYENFRYRYDKKKNPYSKGIPGNLKEVFCSKIPPSMINFRAWASGANESVGTTSVSSESDRGVIGPKDKFQIEVGSRFSRDANKGLPIILRNLDYNAFDENLKRKNFDHSGVVGDKLKRKIGDGEVGLNSVFVHSGQEQQQQQQQYSQWSSGVETSASYDKRTLAPIS